MDGVVVHGIGLGDEPGGVSEDAEALAFGRGGQFAFRLEGAFAEGYVAGAGVDFGASELGFGDVAIELLQQFASFFDGFLAQDDDIAELSQEFFALVLGKAFVSKLD